MKLGMPQDTGMAGRLACRSIVICRMRARLSPFELLDPAAEPAFKERPGSLVHNLFVGWEMQVVYMQPVGPTS